MTFDLYHASPVNEVRWYGLAGREAISEKLGGGVLAGIGLHHCGGIALRVLSRLFGLSGNCWLLVNINFH